MIGRCILFFYGQTGFRIMSLFYGSGVGFCVPSLHRVAIISVLADMYCLIIHPILVSETTFILHMVVGFPVSSSNHQRIKGSYSNEEAIVDPIVIGEGCWLGAHCVVTAGCKIGKGSVLGAGAVVVHDIPDNVLAAGVPARTIKKLEDFL